VCNRGDFPSPLSYLSSFPLRNRLVGSLNVEDAVVDGGGDGEDDGSDEDDDDGVIRDCAVSMIEFNFPSSKEPRLSLNSRERTSLSI